MSTTMKYKWIVSFAIGGVLLVVAMLCGNGQTSYAADPGLNAAPIIDQIVPDQVKAGSSNTPMIIYGSNFGTVEDYIRIWMADAGTDYKIPPLTVIDTGISLVISDTLLTDPVTYTIRVVKSNGQSIPAVPPWYPYDQVSNPVDFLVYAPRSLYLPFINK